jgi:hypothetical protein
VWTSCTIFLGYFGYGRNVIGGTPRLAIGAVTVRKTGSYARSNVTTLVAPLHAALAAVAAPLARRAVPTVLFLFLNLKTPRRTLFHARIFKLGAGFGLDAGNFWRFGGFALV